MRMGTAFLLQITGVISLYNLCNPCQNHPTCLTAERFTNISIILFSNRTCTRTGFCVWGFITGLILSLEHA